MKPFAAFLAGIVLLAGAASRHPRKWTISPAKATAAVYVYEKNDAPVPPGVLAGIDRLNRDRKIVASMFEDDTVDGSGEVPDQYRPALEAAKKSSIPSLVVLSGTSVLTVFKNPKTAEEVMEAVP